MKCHKKAIKTPIPVSADIIQTHSIPEMLYSKKIKIYVELIELEFIVVLP